MTDEARARSNQWPTARAARARPRTHMVAGLVALSALTLTAACGQKGGNDTTPSSTSTTAAGSSTTSGRTASTNASTATTRATTATTGGSSGTSGGSSSKPPVVPKVSDPQYAAYCQSFADFANSLNESSLATDEAFKELVDKYKTTVPKLAETAPPAIKDDMATISKTVESLTEETFLGMQEDPAVKSATDRVDQWLLTNCGFKPG